MSTKIEEIKAEILSLEKHALELWNNGNPDAYLELYADDVTYFDPAFENKFVGKEAVTNYYESFRGKNIIDSFEMINPNVLVMNDCAVLTFDYKSNRDDKTFRMQCTEVYKLNDSGQWKIVHFHWSFVLPDMSEI